MTETTLKNQESTPLVSVIMPVHNAAPWLSEALESVKDQTWKKSLEVSIYDDASKDESPEIIARWIEQFKQMGVSTIVNKNTSGHPGGVGFAKNRAIEQCTGDYLCFMDADDMMAPHRIERQLEAAKENHDTIVGSRFVRLPEDSTSRYTSWANSLQPFQLITQAYTSFGPTVIQPTWFCHRDVFRRSGPFDEFGKGFPEDLTFFMRHISQGGNILRIDETLLTYRYHLSAATFSVHEDTIWNIRVRSLEANILSKWKCFTIWNAGKQGRKLYRSLQPQNREKVLCFCDVDEKKIKKGYYKYENAEGDEPKRTVPVIHFSKAAPPIIVCMKLNMTGGNFEANLDSLGLKEGRDYYHFN